MTDLRANIASRLSTTERSDFLATLLRVARADEVSPAERDRLGPVAAWMGAGDVELTRAMRRADDPTVQMSDLAGSFQRLDDRYLLFRECCAVVWVDGRCSEEEATLLDRLALLLDIDDDPRQVMDSALACSPEGERRFLELLSLTHEALDFP